MENVNQVVENESVQTPTVKVLKRQPGLGRLNRLIQSGSVIVVAKGHSPTRFKRDYNTGSANYKCAHCQANATATLGSGRGETSLAGAALEFTCSNVQPKTES